MITPEIPTEPRKSYSSQQSERTNAVDVVHYRIGMNLKNHWEETQEERYLFLAVEQLDRVSRRYLLKKLSQEETLGLMSLNHENGRHKK